MTSTGTYASTTAPTSQPPVGERSAGRRVAVTLGIVFSVLLIVWGVLWVVSLAIRQEATASASVTDPFSSVVINTDSGDVDVIGGDDSGATVDQRLRWSLTKPTVTTEVRNDVLWITGRCSGFDVGLGCDLDLTVQVPPDTPVEAVTGSGDIDVAGVSDGVTVRTGSGDVMLLDVDGAVQTRTGSGDVRADGVSSDDLGVVTGSGDVSLYLRSEPEDVSVRTGSGDLEIRVPSGDAAYDVDVDTGSGDQTVDVSTDPDSDRSVSARTGSGDVTVTYG